MSRHPSTIPGVKWLSPGLYGGGERMYIVIEEMLAAYGLDDTPANRAQLQAAVAQVGRDTGTPVVDLTTGGNGQNGGKQP